MIMAGNLSPPFFEGIMSTVYIRSKGNWFTWNGTHDAGSLSKPANIVAGDLLMVFVAFTELANWGPKGDSSPNWGRVNNAVDTSIWTRIATADGDDDYDYNAITSTGGQAIGAAQMVAVAGLGWTNKGKQDTAQSAQYSTDNLPDPSADGNDWLHVGVNDLAAAAQDSIVVHRGFKSWPANPNPPYDTIDAPSIGAYSNTSGYSGNCTANDSTPPIVMTDSGASFENVVGKTINNLTDGSSGEITAYTGTSVTATLSGGTNNDWTSGDAYSIAIPVLTRIDSTTLLGEDDRRWVVEWGWRYDPSGNDARVRWGDLDQSPLDTADRPNFGWGGSSTCMTRIIEE